MNTVINQLERNSADNGVVTVHYSCVETDGDYSARINSTCSFTPDPTKEGYTPYESLTEADVIGWVESTLDVEAVTASLQQRIEDQKNPPVLTGMPWTGSGSTLEDPVVTAEVLD